MAGEVYTAYVPLGIWPLCAIGVQMPGCLLSGDMQREWLEMVYRFAADGTVQVLSQRVIFAVPAKGGK